MDVLMNLSDQLLVELMTYEKALDYVSKLQSQIRVMCRNFARQCHRDPDITLARIATSKHVLEMYDLYRLNKWNEIHELADHIRDVAVSHGFTSYEHPILEDRNIVAMETSDYIYMTKYYINKDSIHSRPN